MADHELDGELERIAGNRKTAAQVRRALERLREGAAGPDLAEMARDVLDGRISLRDVARSSAYAVPLADAMHRFTRWQAGLSDEERADITRIGEPPILPVGPIDPDGRALRGPS
nr:hypothetical protein [uncultured Actinoplanes sp.]